MRRMMFSSIFQLIFAFIVVQTFTTVVYCDHLAISPRLLCDHCDTFACCLEAGAGASVVNPTDCKSYYFCVNDVSGNVVPSDQPISCDQSEHFDEASYSCKGPADCLAPCVNYECKSQCTTDFEPIAYPNDCSKYYLCIPNEDPITENCTSPDLYFDGNGCTDNPFTCCDICTPYCPEANIEVQDPTDCTRYYLCIAADSKPTDIFDCPPGNYFDSTSGVCKSDGGVPCDTVCPL